MKYVTLKPGPWKLTDLVKDHTSNEFQAFLDSIEAKTKQFEERRKDLHSDIPATDFEGMIHSLEEIYEKLSIASGYAHLRYYADTSSNDAAALVSRMEKLAADSGNKLLFFSLWFKKEIDEANAQRLINSVPSVYKEYLRHKRLLAKYTLTEPEEKIINIMDVTGVSALVKIYDRMTSAFEFIMTIKKGRKTVKKTFTNKEKLISYVRSARPQEREAAYKSLLHVYSKNSGVLGEIYRNVVLQWRDIGIQLRGYKSPISIRNIANDVDDATADALLSVCRRNATVFQEYFKEKAKMLGVRKLRRYDLYAPASAKARSKKFTYGKAVDTVLRTFESFDTRFGKFAEQVFAEEHVDSAIRNSKRGGAFCHTVSPRLTPYVLLNFDGKTKDVFTLAHEFGHAIHSLASADKPITVQDAPLPLAETASVFAEELLADRLMKEMSPKERKLLLAEQVDDMYATIMRQAYFTLFEVDAHREISEHNATIDKVSEVYLGNLREQFGDSLMLSKDFQHEWLYIPHFYHTPFYCYAYSFGNLLVLSLYQQYRQEGNSFVPKYLDVLSAGGSRKPEDLLMDNGIDITKEQFWQGGFDLVRAKVQELGKL